MKPFHQSKPVKTIGVCAPSARFSKDQFDQGVYRLEELGFDVEIPEEIFLEKRYLAGDDKARAGTVHQLFFDPDIDAIICARGGYGAMRILEHMDWKVLKNNPKPFIGFSDATALLLSILDQSQIPVIHGPNLVSIGSAAKQTLDSFLEILSGNISPIHVLDGQVIVPGECSGILKGGNLSTISHLIGTPFQPDFIGSILFIEDVGEPAYKVDRMLTQMQMAQLFDGITGVILGSFERCDNESYLEEIFFEIFEKYNIPVLSGIKSGHGNINHSLLMGMSVRMATDDMEIYWL